MRGNLDSFKSSRLSGSLCWWRLNVIDRKCKHKRLQAAWQERQDLYQPSRNGLCSYSQSCSTVYDRAHDCTSSRSDQVLRRTSLKLVNARRSCHTRRLVQLSSTSLRSERPVLAQPVYLRPGRAPECGTPKRCPRQYRQTTVAISNCVDVVHGTSGRRGDTDSLQSAI